eukprot:5726964-Pyramimonas_sp.AAC.1
MMCARGIMSILIALAPCRRHDRRREGGKCFLIHRPLGSCNIGSRNGGSTRTPASPCPFWLKP